MTIRRRRLLQNLNSRRKFRALTSCLGIAALALVLSGCWMLHVGQVVNPDNPFRDIRRIAIAPVLDLTVDQALKATDAGYGAVALGTILSTEIAQFDGFEVIRSEEVLNAIRTEKMVWTVEDGVLQLQAPRLMKALRADALLVCAVTDFDPYGDPRVSVAAQLFVGSVRGRWSADLNRLLQSGRPVDIASGREQGMVISFERVYDAQQRRTRERVEAYARYKHDTSERGLTPFEVFTRDTGNYFRFVFNQVVREVVRQGGELEELWNKDSP
ncbi:MAG: hypothetical protein QF752_12115 [Planctomycetota bacterium]|nr:hypothetical protein [Planctomycetota bacterium]